MKVLRKLIKITVKGFSYISYTISKGFYHYFESFFKLIKRIFGIKSKTLNKIIYHFEKRKNQPEYLLLIIVYAVALYTIVSVFYCNDNKVINIKEDIILNKETDTDKDIDNNENKKLESNIINNKNGNLFKRYGSVNLEDVDLNYFKKLNSDTVAWLSVDSTNINYPIVKYKDNQYYLNHSFDKNYKNSGWVYMDYRNNNKLMDYNTIFYGHNLYNKTSFGSISNIFTEEWLNKSNRSIIVITNNKKYVYKIFSAYIIEPETYYLKNNFSNKENYQEFLNTIVARNSININESVTINDKIITLSTCSDDNKGRKVVHAKLIN